VPAGPSLIGAATFVAVKLLGYGYAGVRLNRVYGPTLSWNAGAFGLARTLLGLGVGAAFAWLMLQWELDHGMLIWFVLLFPVRLGEWLLMIWLVFERRAEVKDFRRLLRYSLVGSAWSYLLDLPAALSVIVVPGGMWVC
jgi:hypothetical protein